MYIRIGTLLCWLHDVHVVDANRSLILEHFGQYLFLIKPCSSANFKTIIVSRRESNEVSFSSQDSHFLNYFF